MLKKPKQDKHAYVDRDKTNTIQFIQKRKVSLFGFFTHTNLRLFIQAKQHEIELFINLPYFSSLGLTIRVTIQYVDVNIFNGHDIGFQVHFESLSIHHILISFDVHDCYCSRW